MQYALKMHRWIMFCSEPAIELRQLGCMETTYSYSNVFFVSLVGLDKLGYVIQFQLLTISDILYYNYSYERLFLISAYLGNVVAYSS
jgi:hypothetical protein